MLTIPITNLKAVNDQPKHLAMGLFDGVHLGHKTIIEKMVKKAKKDGVIPAVFTLDNHVNKEGELILSIDQRLDHFKSLGVELVYLLKVGTPVMNIEFQTIIEYLRSENIQTIFTGHDYRFGTRADGTVTDLQANFDTIIINDIKNDGARISSSTIKSLLKNGEVEQANKILDYNYCLEGQVVLGKQLGRTIGFPTANLKTDKQTLLKTGVYITKTTIDGYSQQFNSLTNVGFNPTVNNNQLTVETFIDQFQDDIYGKIIKVEFIKYIRTEIKFNSIEELKQQLIIDLSTLRENY